MKYHDDDGYTSSQLKLGQADGHSYRIMGKRYTRRIFCLNKVFLESSTAKFALNVGALTGLAVL